MSTLSHLSVDVNCVTIIRSVLHSEYSSAALCLSTATACHLTWTFTVHTICTTQSHWLQSNSSTALATIQGWYVAALASPFCEYFNPIFSWLNSIIFLMFVCSLAAFLSHHTKPTFLHLCVWLILLCSLVEWHLCTSHTKYLFLSWTYANHVL